MSGMQYDTRNTINHIPEYRLEQIYKICSSHDFTGKGISRAWRRIVRGFSRGACTKYLYSLIGSKNKRKIPTGYS
jgi:hypothetical protein